MFFLFVTALDIYKQIKQVRKHCNPLLTLIATINGNMPDDERGVLAMVADHVVGC